MDARWIQTAFLGLAGLTLANGGCTSIWRDVPLTPSAAPKVQLDAAWYSESSSPEATKRMTKERQEHISSTLEQRKQGKVALSLEELLVQSGSPNSSGGKAAAASPTTTSANASVILRSQPPLASVAAGDAESVASGADPDASSTPAKPSRGKIVIEVAGGERLVR